MQIPMTNKEIQEYREEMLLDEATQKKLHTNRAIDHMKVLYQHTSKFIIDPSKRSESWPSRINDEYVRTVEEIEKAAKDIKGKNAEKKILDQINRFYKDDIIKDGADKAKKELDKKHKINIDDFYQGEVPELFDIKTIFSDKDKFIDGVVKLSKEYDKKDHRRSRDSELAIQTLLDYKSGGKHDKAYYDKGKRRK